MAAPGTGKVTDVSEVQEPELEQAEEVRAEGEKGMASARLNKEAGTKSRRTVAKEQPTGTPVCIAALFCDSAFIDEYQTMTIIRTIDTITFPSGIEHKPGEVVELEGSNRLVIMLKRDDATGLHELPVDYLSPSGKVDRVGLIRQAFSKDVEPEAGYNFVSRIQFIWRGDGLYWLRIHSGKRIIAKTALRVKIASPRPAAK